MFTKQLFGERLRLVRKNAGDTQPDMGALIGVTATQISDMENGKILTTIEKLSMICEHYHVSSDYLMGLSDNPKPYGK